MQIALFSDNVRIVTAEGDAAARRLQRRLGVPAHDPEDLRQDLILDLIGRLSVYEPARGSRRRGILTRHGGRWNKFTGMNLLSWLEGSLQARASRRS